MKGIILNLESLERVKSLNLVTTKYNFIAINKHGKALFRNLNNQKIKEVKIPYVKGQEIYVKEKYSLEKALDHLSPQKAFNINDSIVYEGETSSFIEGKSRTASSMIAAMARKKVRVVNVIIRPADDDLARTLNFWRVSYHFEVI